MVLCKPKPQETGHEPPHQIRPKPTQWRPVVPPVTGRCPGHCHLLWPGGGAGDQLRRCRLATSLILGIGAALELPEHGVKLKEDRAMPANLLPKLSTGGLLSALPVLAVAATFQHPSGASFIYPDSWQAAPMAENVLVAPKAAPVSGDLGYRRMSSTRRWAGSAAGRSLRSCSAPTPRSRSRWGFTANCSRRYAPTAAARA